MRYFYVYATPVSNRTPVVIHVDPTNTSIRTLIVLVDDSLLSKIRSRTRSPDVFVNVAVGPRLTPFTARSKPPVPPPIDVGAVAVDVPRTDDILKTGAF